MDSLRALIEFDFESGLVNGESMIVELINDHKSIRLENLSSGITTGQLEVIFPTTVEILITGKKEFDTEVDEQGNIISDKYIKLTDIRVDGLSVDDNYLARFVEFDTLEHGKIITNYFGFNGKALINFMPTPFQWLVGTKKL